MVRRLVVLAVLSLLVRGAAADGPSSALPVVSFQDQDGRQLDLGALRGQVVVIVYGSRSGVRQHVTWGKRLAAEVEQPLRRGHPVQILALAQMGGIPEAFRSLVRHAIRPHVEAGYSLWLDWNDRMSTLFGDHDPASTVVVADAHGKVLLVVSGPPEGAPYRAVSELLQRLR
jgi:hypothetical protein